LASETVKLEATMSDPMSDLQTPGSASAEAVYNIILQAGSSEGRPVPFAEEAAPALADALYKLGAQGIILDWTLTPAGITLTFAPDGPERLRQMIAGRYLATTGWATPTNMTPLKPMCEICHTKHWGYEDHDMA
jgi:hypothetical protein